MHMYQITAMATERHLCGPFVFLFRRVLALKHKNPAAGRRRPAVGLSLSVPMKTFEPAVGPCHPIWDVFQGFSLRVLDTSRTVLCLSTMAGLRSKIEQESVPSRQNGMLCCHINISPFITRDTVSNLNHIPCTADSASSGVLFSLVHESRRTLEPSI